jgi:hypothetical protein
MEWPRPTIPERFAECSGRTYATEWKISGDLMTDTGHQYSPRSRDHPSIVFLHQITRYSSVRLFQGAESFASLLVLPLLRTRDTSYHQSQSNHIVDGKLTETLTPTCDIVSFCS